MKDSPQATALFKSVERMKQIAEAHAPAFIELARGAPGVGIQPNRPGLPAVSRLLGLVFVADAQCRVLKNLLVEAAVTTAADFDKFLAAEVEASAEALAASINDGTAGIRHPFAFQPIAETQTEGVA